MKERILLIDSNYLCWRAFHTPGMGDLSYHGDPTTVAYGFFRDLKNLQELYATNTVALCFDHGPYKRSEIYPDYKVRAELTFEEKEVRSKCRKQINNLRDELLPEAGYRNIYHYMGYEADDMIAACCDRLKKGDQAVIVSADKDLYQLLSDKVVMYNPSSKRVMDIGWLYEEYGVVPSDWPEIKAMVGCESDNVKGIYGIGEKKASDWMSGRKRTDAIGERIRYNTNLINRNLKLVKLPFDDEFMVPPMIPDEVNHKSWNKVMQKLGIETLI